jgi:hypothetical protein
MSNLVTFLVGAAWLAIFGMLVWGILSGWRRQLKQDSPLPLFQLLARSGVSPAQAEAALGSGDLARAARSCALCATRSACESGVMGGWLGEFPAGCPNMRLFVRLSALTPAP